MCDDLRFEFKRCNDLWRSASLRLTAQISHIYRRGPRPGRRHIDVLSLLNLATNAVCTELSHSSVQATDRSVLLACLSQAFLFIRSLLTAIPRVTLYLQLSKLHEISTWRIICSLVTSNIVICLIPVEFMHYVISSQSLRKVRYFFHTIQKSGIKSSGRCKKVIRIIAALQSLLVHACFSVTLATLSC